MCECTSVYSQSKLLVPAWIQRLWLHRRGADELGRHSGRQAVAMFPPVTAVFLPLEAEPETANKGTQPGSSVSTDINVKPQEDDK